MYGSGLAELLCAALVMAPPTRRAGAWGAAGLFVAVFPGNVTHAIRAGAPGRRGGGMRATVAWLRLPLQGPLVWWAVRLAGGAGGPAGPRARAAPRRARGRRAAVAYVK